MRRLRVLLLVVPLLVAACGDDDAATEAGVGDTSGTQDYSPPGADGGADDGGGEAAGASTTLALVASDIAFDAATLQADAGTIVIEFENTDEGISHNLHVTGDGVDERTEVQAGPVEQTLRLDLDPGSYEFVCDVHASMQGTLEVG